MAGGLAVTGGFAQLLTKDYAKVFFDSYMRYPELFSQVAHVETKTGNSYKEGELAGLGSLQSLNQGQAIPFEVPIQGNEKEITYDKFGLGFQITEEMWDDDLTGHMKKIPAELGKAAAYTRELQFWQMLNSGFDTTYHTGLDSLALFDDSHTLPDGSATIDNQATAAALSATSFKAAVLHFRKLVNGRNIPIVMDPVLLVIPPELEFMAKELLLSPYKPATADNDINVINRLGIEYLVVPYMTSTTAWFLFAKEHDLRFIWRKKVAFTSQDDFNTGNGMFKAVTRFATEFWDPRGSYGNAGA